MYTVVYIHVTSVSMYKSICVLMVYRCIYQWCCNCRVIVYVYSSLYTCNTVSMYKSICVLRVYRCIYQGCCSCRVTVYMYLVVYIHVTCVYVQAYSILYIGGIHMVYSVCMVMYISISSNVVIAKRLAVMGKSLANLSFTLNPRG